MHSSAKILITTGIVQKQPGRNVSNLRTKYRILSRVVAGLLHGQYSKFRQRISPVVVASDVLAGFYIKYYPGIVFVMARLLFIASEGKNLHNVPGYCWAMPVV